MLAIGGSSEYACEVAENSANTPGVETPVPRNPLSIFLLGSLWRLQGMEKKEYNGRLCRVLSVEGKVAKVTFVGDKCGPKFCLNCSRLVRPDEYGVVATESDEQVYARILAQKEFDRLGRLGEYGSIY